jgi:hypothetical protein
VINDSILITFTMLLLTLQALRRRRKRLSRRPMVNFETRPPMETREVLLKADQVAVVFERLAGGKIRVTTSSWDDAKVILPNHVLEVASIGKQFGLVRVDKPIAYLDIDDTGLVSSALTTDMVIFRRVAKVRHRCTHHIRAARSGGKVSAFALRRRVTGRKRDALHCNTIERYTVTSNDKLLGRCEGDFTEPCA